MLVSARSLRLSLATITITAAAFLSLSTTHAQAATVEPWVHVQGTGFADQNGNAVTLRGVNLTYAAGTRTADLVKSTGANMVRIVAPWSEAETTAPTGGTHHWNATFLAKTDQLVSAFQAHGIAVLIDMHQMDWSPYFGGRGIPAWYYTGTKKGQFPRSKTGLKAAETAWWTDATGQGLYTDYARMMATRYSAYPNVVGFEVFNEPFTGNLKKQAATQAVIDWTAPIRSAIRQITPSRAVFMQVRTGGDLGLMHADFSSFGNLANVVIDYHDYYNGSAGAGWSADQLGWTPSWDATHNQNSLNYHGTQAALDANLAPLVQRTRQLNVPLFIGEWGAQTADKGVMTYQHHMFSVLSKYGLSWTRWDIRGDRWAMADAKYQLNAVGRDFASHLQGAAPAGQPAPNPTGTPVDLTGLATKAFTGSTYISFNLSAPASVSISIKNAAGTEVLNLGAKSYGAGQGGRYWSHKLFQHKPAPHGTYTIVVTADAGGATSSATTTVTI